MICHNIDEILTYIKLKFVTVEALFKIEAFCRFSWLKSTRCKHSDLEQQFIVQPHVVRPVE